MIIKLSSTIKELLGSEDPFLQKCGNDLKRATINLKHKTITEKEFISDVADIKDLVTAKLLEESVKHKALLEKAAHILENIAVEGITGIIESISL